MNETYVPNLNHVQQVGDSFKTTTRDPLLAEALDAIVEASRVEDLDFVASWLTRFALDWKRGRVTPANIEKHAQELIEAATAVSELVKAYTDIAKRYEGKTGLKEAHRPTAIAS